jgi:hypothetical protein
LCVVTLGDEGISSSFVVVRRRSSYSSYGIRTTPKKIQIKQKRMGKYVCFFFLQWRWQLAKQKRRRGPKNKIK